MTADAVKLAKMVGALALVGLAFVLLTNLLDHAKGIVTR